MTLSVAIRHRQGPLDLDVAFEAEGGTVALFGQSGAGKTTVVRAIAGLIRPDAGRITLQGETLLDTGAGTCLPPHRRRIGYVFQDARLFPHLTVRQNLVYGRWFARARDEKDVARVVALLGLGALLDRRPGRLSGGEAQRVAIGRALLSEPRLLLMDEPLASLDAARREEILPYLERLRDETALPIVYVSHSVPEIARLASRVVVIEAGRAIAQGPVRDVLSEAAFAPALGAHGAGALLAGRIARHHADDGLTEIDLAGTPFFTQAVQGPAGTEVSIRIEAEDIVLATERPRGISTLNILDARVAEVTEGAGPSVIVTLDAAPGRLVARITGRSARALGLAPGRPVVALLKSSRIAPAMPGGQSV